MSRVGKNPVKLPSGVSGEYSEGIVQIKGPKGNLSVRIHPAVAVTMESDRIVVAVASASKENRALWGTMRNLLQQAVKGVIKPYERKIELTGVGFQAALDGDTLVMSLGYSHPVRYALPAGVKAVLEKPTLILLSSINSEVLGKVVAELKALRKVEPYKGQGVKEFGQFVLRKEGKKK